MEKYNLTRQTKIIRSVSRLIPPTRVYNFAFERKRKIISDCIPPPSRASQFNRGFLRIIRLIEILVRPSHGPHTYIRTFICTSDYSTLIRNGRSVPSCERIKTTVICAPIINMCVRSVRGQPPGTRLQTMSAVKFEKNKIFDTAVGSQKRVDHQPRSVIFTGRERVTPIASNRTRGRSDVTSNANVPRLV